VEPTGTDASHRYCMVQDEGRLRIVTLNRPEVMNALHSDASHELARVWDEFAARDDLWVGIVTGAGERALCAGNDLKVQAAGKRGPRPHSGFDEPCLETAIRTVYPAHQANLDSQDYSEGPKAFAEKRKPGWKNR